MSAIYTVLTMQANSLLGCMSYAKGHSAEQSYVDCVAKEQFTSVILLRDGVIIKTSGVHQTETPRHTYKSERDRLADIAAEGQRAASGIVRNDYDATNPAFAGDALFMTEAERRANAAEAKLREMDKRK